RKHPFARQPLLVVGSDRANLDRVTCLGVQPADVLRRGLEVAENSHQTQQLEQLLPSIWKGDSIELVGLEHRAEGFRDNAPKQRPPRAAGDVSPPPQP